jgi:prefoldin subunit 5
MKEQLQQRLQQLKAEFESGQKVLADLEAKQTSVRETLLRIAGAIQVLEELKEAESDTMTTLAENTYPLHSEVPSREVAPQGFEN